MSDTHADTRKDPIGPLERCVRCGEWAEGFASSWDARRGERRLCHGAGRDCYSADSWDRTFGRDR